MSNSLPRIPIDDDIRDADWVKRARWDLPTSVGPFLWAIGAGDQRMPIAERRAAVDRFMALPAAAMMPTSLRRSLERAGLL